LHKNGQRMCVQRGEPNKQNPNKQTKAMNDCEDQDRYQDGKKPNLLSAFFFGLFFQTSFVALLCPHFLIVLFGRMRFLCDWQLPFIFY